MGGVGAALVDIPALLSPSLAATHARRMVFARLDIDLVLTSGDIDSVSVLTFRLTPIA
jgi:hypothetical protein